MATTNKTANNLGYKCVQKGFTCEPGEQIDGGVLTGLGWPIYECPDSGYIEMSPNYGVYHISSWGMVGQGSCSLLNQPGLIDYCSSGTEIYGETIPGYEDMGSMTSYGYYVIGCEKILRTVQSPNEENNGRELVANRRRRPTRKSLYSRQPNSRRSNPKGRPRPLPGSSWPQGEIAGETTTGETTCWCTPQAGPGTGTSGAALPDCCPPGMRAQRVNPNRPIYNQSRRGGTAGRPRHLKDNSKFQSTQKDIPGGLNSNGNGNRHIGAIDSRKPPRRPQPLPPHVVGGFHPYPDDDGPSVQPYPGESCSDDGAMCYFNDQLAAAQGTLPCCGQCQPSTAYGGQGAMVGECQSYGTDCGHPYTPCSNWDDCCSGQCYQPTNINFASGQQPQPYCL